MVVGAGLAATAAQVSTVAGPSVLWLMVAPEAGAELSGAASVT